MNMIIPLNGLAARLALRENLSEEKAKNFVVVFFNIIEQTLSKGESVSVKGLGTFKIDRGNVVFEPDEQLAAAANEPFDMFSSIELDENLDISEIEIPSATEDNQE